VRTGQNVHVIDSWCARRTLQTLEYLDALISRINLRLLDRDLDPQDRPLYAGNHAANETTIAGGLRLPSPTINRRNQRPHVGLR
jgi:hypothetical protein